MQEMKDIQEERRVAMDSVASRMGNKTIEVSGLCKSYGDKKLIDNYEYIFLKNDRIGIIGPNGCGKSTLLKMIYGNVEPDAGTIEIGQTIRMGYFSQENEEMDLIASAGIAENEIKLGKDEYFVLGDNCNNSEDSRSANVGPVLRSTIVGEAWFHFGNGTDGWGLIH